MAGNSLSNGVDDDEYLAKLLAKDARDSSIKYSAHGLQALLPKRATSSAPKPNTRFLKNIIRETDNHNAALKKKEEVEARQRLRQLRNGAQLADDSVKDECRDGRDSKRRRLEDSRNRNREGRHSHRSRRYDDDDSEDSVRERRRKERRRHKDRDESEEDRSRKSARREDQGTYQHPNSRRGRDRSNEAPSSRKHRRKNEDHRSSRHHRRRRSYSESTSRSRSRSPDPSKHRSRKDRDYRHRHSRRRTRSPSSSSPSRSRDQSRNHHKREKRHHTNSGGNSNCTGTTIPPQIHHFSDHSSSDSDPLTSLIGPAPARPLTPNSPAPLRSRGRGAHKSTSTSAMNAHFSSTYDPTLDPHPASEPDEEKEDWDMALEALRDRQLWKKKGAERLREAGFGEEEVLRWEKSGTGTGTGVEKGVEDVKWAGKGEGREWDRGKVVDEEGGGEVEVRASWSSWSRGNGRLSPV